MKVVANNDEREISLLTSHNRKLQNETDALKEQLDQSLENVSELKKKLSKSESEGKLWKTKYENESLPKIDELEEDNMKLKERVDVVEHTIEESNMKISTLKKQKTRLTADIKDVKLEIEDQKKHTEDKVKKIKDLLVANERLKIQAEDLKIEIENLRRDNNLLNTENSKRKQDFESISQQNNLQKNENANLQNKISKQCEEISLLDFKIMELDQMKKKIESEKEDLAMAMDDLEFAMDKSNTKYNNLVIEHEKQRYDLEQRMEERDLENRSSIQKMQNLIEIEKSKFAVEEKRVLELKR